MSFRPRFVLSFALSILALQTLTTAQTPPPAQEWVPPDAVISLHLSQPKALLELLAGADMTKAITALPLFQEQTSKPQFQEFLNLVRFLETALDTDWRTGLAKLTGAGVTLAVCPGDTVVVIIDGEDQRLLERLHEIFLNIARSEADQQGHPELVASREYAGVTVWTFDGKEAHAIIGKRLIFASRREGLQAALDLRDRGRSDSLAASPAFRAAARAAGTNAAGTAFVNLKGLIDLPAVSQLLDQQRKNPLAALAFAGIVESVRSSNWLALGLRVEDNAPAVRALTDGKPAGATSPAAFALPQDAGVGAWPNLVVPRRLAALSLYRDLHSFYAAKDDLFPERTSGLIFFENMMGIFFSGRDLTSEVLAETQPEIRIVVAEQQFDPAIGTPQTKLPAFAVVLRLRHPDQFREVMEEAWQKAVGLINFTRGQQALPGLIIDRPIHAGTKFTIGYFSTADVQDRTKLDQRFNLRPALAMPGEYLILSSTDALARDLIETLGREGAQAGTPLAQTHSLVEVEGAHVASALGENRDALVRSDMVKKGRTREEAEAGIDMLLTAVRLLDQVSLNIGTHDGLTEAKLRIKLNLSSPLQ